MEGSSATIVFSQCSFPFHSALLFYGGRKRERMLFSAFFLYHSTKVYSLLSFSGGAQSLRRGKRARSKFLTHGHRVAHKLGIKSKGRDEETLLASSDFNLFRGQGKRLLETAKIEAEEVTLAVTLATDSVCPPQQCRGHAQAKMSSRLSLSFF